MEKKENKKGKYVTIKGTALTVYIIVIVVIASAICFGTGFYLGKKVCEPSKKKDKTEEKEKIEKKDEVVNTSNSNEELANIAGINNNDPVGTIVINDGVLNDFSNEDKSRIVYDYARRNNLTKTVTGEETVYCADGSGMCLGIKVSDYNEIMKKYGFENFTPEIYGSECHTYDNMYLFNYGGDYTPYVKTLHNINQSTDGDDIIITDTMTYVASKESGVEDRELIKEFTFKKTEETGQYYLFSVYTR